MRWLSIVAIAFLTSTWSIAASAGKSNSSDSSPQEILNWLETLKFPRLERCPYVEVTITEADPPPGQKPDFVRVDGFLLKDSGKTFTVFVIELKEKLDTYYPMMDPPFWPLTEVTIEKDSSKGKERASYRVVDLDTEASALARELALPNTAKINLKLWDEAAFRHVSKPTAIAFFASACRQNHREKIATELIKGLTNTYERYLSDGEKEKPLQKFLQDSISEVVLWRATLQFKDPLINRKEILTTFQDLRERFPQSRYQSTIQETIKTLELMVQEDQQHRPKDLEKLTADEKMGELIFQLRDQTGIQEMQPGWCNIFARDDPKNPQSPASQLLRVGYPAVPQLIAALDDQRLSRSIHFWRGYTFSHYVLRVSDCAQQILERIANRKFYEPKATGSDMTSDGAVASTKHAVESWWSEFQKKGEEQSLIDAVSAGDENSPAQAETLLQKYNSSAPRAIMTGASASKNDRIHATLLMLLENAKGDEVVTFLREQMKESPGLEARLAAALVLFDHGEAESVTSMIQEFNSISPKLAQSTWHDDDRDAIENLIEFLANSGRTDAVKTLAQSVHNVSKDTRAAIVSVLAPSEQKLGLRRGAAAQREGPAGDAGADQEAQMLLASLLDDRSILSTSGGIGEKDLDYQKARLCDYAGFVLAKRWPQKYKFYWSLNLQENDRQLNQLKIVSRETAPLH
jgi:hypothetical protein